MQEPSRCACGGSRWVTKQVPDGKGGFKVVREPCPQCSGSGGGYRTK